MNADDKESVVVMGAGAVGKSALVVRFTTDTFVEDYDPTLEDNYRKEVHVDGEDTTLDILDTAGQEEFQSMHDRWVRPANGIVLVYSITNKDTFEEVKTLRTKIKRIKDTVREMEGEEKQQSFIPLILVGNKSDLADEREVEESEAKACADLWEAPFFETSAKTNINVEACFHQLIREIKKSKSNINQSGGDKKGGCCVLL